MSTASAPGLSERLLRYSRYVALVAEQLDAVRDSDAEKLRALLEERFLLEAELEGRPPDEVGASVEAALQDGIEALADRIDEGQRMQERWSRISEGALRSARTLGRQRLTGRYPEVAAGQTRVDLRL